MQKPTKAEKAERQIKFGAYLRDLREDKKLSIKDVAKGIGATGPYWYQVENGTRGLTDSVLYRNLAALFEISGVELLQKAGYLPPKEDKDEEFESRFQKAASDRRFRFGAKLRRKTDINAKRFIVELYEKLRMRE